MTCYKHFQLLSADLDKIRHKTMYLMLFGRCVFCEYRRREGGAFLMSVNEITFNHAPRKHMTFWE
jgi:hypothetical protein